MQKLPYAEDINYWQTGQTAADTWIDKAKKEIKSAGGKVIGDVFGNDALTGRSAFMIQFSFGQDAFKLVWPVLPSRSGKERAARIQAATMLYHDVKARCVSAKVIGNRAAFFTYILLPDGQSAASVELTEVLPALFTQPLLTQKEG